MEYWIGILIEILNSWLVKVIVGYLVLRFLCKVFLYTKYKKGVKTGKESDIVTMYSNWLMNNTVTKADDMYEMICLPYLDIRNDHIMVLVSKISNGKYSVSDGIYVFNEARLYGFQGIPDEIKPMINSADIRVEFDLLEPFCTKEELPQAINNMAMAMVVASYLLPEMATKK